MQRFDRFKTLRPNVVDHLLLRNIFFAKMVFNAKGYLISLDEFPLLARNLACRALQIRGSRRLITQFAELLEYMFRFGDRRHF
ncbi:hypothetical protein WL29_34840 [Burkholderia ubonensis]|uniref:Uncharacterized protein n=1 Tax=Burkholderia ubonensis TaxID=101571 RepID=A0A106PZQ9_9BURK|nr:hypothetical protein WL29_34840 [Burkholderia ubonensis]